MVGQDVPAVGTLGTAVVGVGVGVGVAETAQVQSDSVWQEEFRQLPLVCPAGI